MNFYKGFKEITWIDMDNPNYIKTGWLVNGTGGHIREDVVLKISEGILISINESRYFNSDEKDVTDYSDYTILPGLVDCHIHLSISGTEDPEFRNRQLTFPYTQVRKVIWKHLQDHFNNGVIAVRDGGDRNGHVLRYKNESQKDIDIPVHYATAGKGWHSEGRYGKMIARNPFKGLSLAQSIEKDHDSIDCIKIINSGLNSLAEYGKETPPQFDLDELMEAVRVGNNLGLKTMVHANGKEPVRLAIEAGCHSIEHGYFMGDDNLKRMADNGIFWIPTLIPIYAITRKRDKEHGIELDVAKRTLEHQLNQVRKASNLGVRIAIGTDAGSPGVHHGKAIWDEIRLMMSAGLSIERTIECGTSNGAQLLDIEDKIGRLIPGMPATFIVVKGDPNGLPDVFDDSLSVRVNGKKVSHRFEGGREGF